jgi:hypothetical protein
MRTLKNIGWIFLLLAPFIIWIFLYCAYYAEYDKNYSYLIEAFLISLLVLLLFFILKRFDKEGYTKFKWRHLFTILFGSPLTFLFIWVFISYISMNFKWMEYNSTTDEKYSLTKYQNLFKSEYVYVDEERNSDTLTIVVSRNNKIISIKKNNGKIEVELNVNDLPNKEQISKLGLFRYDKP